MSRSVSRVPRNWALNDRCGVLATGKRGRIVYIDKALWRAVVQFDAGGREALSLDELEMVWLLAPVEVVA